MYEIKLRQSGVLRSETLRAGTTEKKAKTEWKKASAKRDEGGAPLSHDVKLTTVADEAFADFEMRVRAGIRSQRTLDGYRSDWNVYIAPVLGAKRIAKVTPHDILVLVASLRSKGLAEWTASGVVTCLRTVFRYARHAGYTANDPFSFLAPDDLPQQRARETFDARVLRPAEIQRLIGATTPTFRNVVALLAFSGLRVSEAAGLIWADIDLVDRVVHVREQLAPLRRGEPPKRVKPKSRASVRDVPLLDRAYVALVDQLRSEQAKGFGGDSDFVFTSAAGRPLGRDRISKRGVGRAAERAGIGHVTAQTLRRSVATATAHARLPVVIAAAMTGHSPQVYDRHYARPFRDAEERNNVRVSLASIGFGNAPVDQSVDQNPISGGRVA